MSNERKCDYCDDDAVAYSPIEQFQFCLKHYEQDLLDLEFKLYRHLGHY